MAVHVSRVMKRSTHSKQPREKLLWQNNQYRVTLRKMTDIGSGGKRGLVVLKKLVEYLSTNKYLCIILQIFFLFIFDFFKHPKV